MGPHKSISPHHHHYFITIANLVFRAGFPGLSLFCIYIVYIGSVDRKSSLSKCQKLHYLKSYLDGEALSLVKHIPISDANYQDAWERIGNRYNKKSLIARSFIQNILSLPTAKGSNIAEVRKMVDTADECIRGLHVLSCDSRDVWLIHILLSKLDPECKEAWATSSESCKENVTINNLFGFVFARCDALESCQDPKLIHDTHTVLNKRRAFLIMLTGQIRLFVIEYIVTSNTVTRDGYLCFNCLSRSHQVQECNSTKLRHHTLVHPEDIRSVTASTDVNTSAQPPARPVSLLMLILPWSAIIHWRGNSWPRVKPYC
ncbi:uncharacterized protein LOC117188104 [Drosophila miranda]|uniref:uncharacterized protein LOC117188104 n=1 Tax=Drosophila miranda TaxID=7229 RepID=UPI00143F7C86|nr:uncharacterized protein LOC117188104 [Drosophila miranda]XP_033247334.1 uncharacterized protein LOC117188104 [Drosophila miranda]